MYDYWNNWPELIRQKIQLCFDWYRDLLPLSDPMFDLMAPMILWSVMFTIIGGLLSLLDLLQWPQFLYRYKIHDVNIKLRHIIKTGKVCLQNQLILHPPTFAAFYYLGNLRGVDRTHRVPSLFTIIWHVLVFSVVIEILFYYIHRLMHTPMLYRRVHKVHHQYQAVQALNTIHTHWVEHLFNNLIPGLLGPLLLGSHVSITSIWMILVVMHVMVDHAGFHFPFCVSPHYHDYHHAGFIENFGRYPVMDYLHGTNRQYYKTINAKRHKNLFTFTPIRVLVPDENKSNKNIKNKTK